MIYTTMSLKQVELLEEVFACFNGDCWELPNWLVRLREIVETKR